MSHPEHEFLARYLNPDAAPPPSGRHAGPDADAPSEDGDTNTDPRMPIPDLGDAFGAAPARGEESAAGPSAEDPAQPTVGSPDAAEDGQARAERDPRGPGADVAPPLEHYPAPAGAAGAGSHPHSGYQYQPHRGAPPVQWPVTPAAASVGPIRAKVRQSDLVQTYKPVPETGWRKRLYKMTRINLGPGPAEREWNDLRRRLSVNLRGTYLIAVVQQKGGVSKTTASIGLGAALARYRNDKVVAIDANPADGNLSSRVDEPSTGTWRSLVADNYLHTYSDYRHYLGKDSSSGLEVLASDPGDVPLEGDNIIDVWRRLSRMYPIAIVDCGNQMRDTVAHAILSMADAVVVVSTTRYDGAKSAENTVNWLESHGYPHLVRSAVMLISNVNRVKPTKQVKALREDFERVVRAVHDVPYDPHLSDAASVDFDRLDPQTRRAFIEAAASLVDGFAAAADKDPGYGASWPADNRGGPQ